MNPPARRHAAAVDTSRPGAAQRPQEQQSHNATAAAVGGSLAAGPGRQQTRQEWLAAEMAQRKLERDQRKAEKAAATLATKLAMVPRPAGLDPRTGWNPVAAGAAAPPRLAHPGRSSTSQAGSQSAASSGCGRKAGLPAGPATSSGSSGSSMAASSSKGGEERHSIGSIAPSGPLAKVQAAPKAAMQPPEIAAEGSDSTLQGCSSSSSIALHAGHVKWSPRKLPRQAHASSIRVATTTAVPAAPKLAQSAAQHLLPKLSGKPSSATAVAASGPLPAQWQLAASPAAAAPAAGGPAAVWPARLVGGVVYQHGVELDSAELEARRIQQLIDWGGLLVQTAANVTAERVLLGPAAQPDSQPLSAAELPISFGTRPPADPAARCTAIQQQVSQALEVLEQQRQLKLRLAQAEGATEADRQLLEAEAAADLQAQSLLAYWGVETAWDERQRQQEGALQVQQVAKVVG